MDVRRFNLRRIYAYGVIIVLLVVILVVASLYPFDTENTFVSVALSVSTFLFGIFVGFSISDRHNRMEKIRMNDSSERSNLVSIFHLSKSFSLKNHSKILKYLDLYLMSILDHTIWDFYKTENDFNKIAGVVDEWKFDGKNSKKVTCYRELIKRIADIRLVRGETAEVINDRISKFEWAIFLFLGTVILASLLLLNTGNMVSISLILALSAAVIFLTYFLYSLDSLSWKAESRIFEPYAETFESMGLTRYYPESLIKEGRVRNYRKVKSRIGVFKNPYPDFSGKKIISLEATK
jgi:hypothetical protein